MQCAGEWLPIEIRTEVFKALLKMLGAKGVQIVEINYDILAKVRPLHGLLFLSKNRIHKTPDPIVTGDRMKTVYFAKQATNNACPTQAMINLLLNCHHPDVDHGPLLSMLKEYSISFYPKMRGFTVKLSPSIRNAHNALAQASENLFGSKVATEDAPYHVMVFIPIGGRLYELDGRKDGFIDHGPVAPDQDWLYVVRPIILQRIGHWEDKFLALISTKSMMPIVKPQVIDLTKEEKEEVKSDAHGIQNLKILIGEMILRYQEQKNHNFLPLTIKFHVMATKERLMPLIDKPMERAQEEEEGGGEEFAGDFGEAQVPPPELHLDAEADQQEPLDLSTAPPVVPVDSPPHMDTLLPDDLKDITLEPGLDTDLDLGLTEILEEELPEMNEMFMQDVLDNLECDPNQS